MGSAQDVFVFSIVVHALLLVAAALCASLCPQPTKKLNKAIKKLRGIDNDRN